MTNKICIKICGITNDEDASYAASFGVNALGFNFFEGSKRFISPTDARAITNNMPKDVWRVGVFVNHSIDDVLSIANLAKLDTIQLHGDEPIEFSKHLSAYRIIRAIRIGDTVDSKLISNYAACSDYLLFDALVGSQFGGTGVEVNTPALMELLSSGILKRSFLAGGLTPINVKERIKTYTPFGVDTASGVEQNPRKKNKELLQRFVGEARACEISQPNKPCANDFF